ncbi:MAG: hypothetical protein PSY14_11775 [bacterium]|nr:hypothetical protein [bacterium]
MFDRLSSWFDNFYDTIKAGYYTPAAPHKIHDDSALPHKPWVTTALGALGLSSALASNTVIDMMIGASLIGVAAGMGLAAVTGVALLGALYLHSKKSGAVKIAETNMAGQKVSGSRADLYTLHTAQKKIISLTATFSEVAGPAVINAEVMDIIADSKAARDRVQVIDHGSAPASKVTYEFVRPVVQFADAALMGGAEESPAPVRHRHAKAHRQPQPAHA